MPKKSEDKSAFEIGVDAALTLLKALFTSSDKRNPGEKIVDSMKEVKSESEKIAKK